MFEGNDSYSTLYFSSRRSTLIIFVGLVHRIFLVHETQTAMLSMQHGIVSVSMNSVICSDVISVCHYIDRYCVHRCHRRACSILFPCVCEYRLLCLLHFGITELGRSTPRDIPRITFGRRRVTYMLNDTKYCGTSHKLSSDTFFAEDPRGCRAGRKPYNGDVGIKICSRNPCHCQRLKVRELGVKGDPGHPRKVRCPTKPFAPPAYDLWTSSGAR